MCGMQREAWKNLNPNNDDDNDKWGENMPSEARPKKFKY